MQLATSVGRIQFATPLILASGYITETPEFFLKSKKNGCSAMVTRSLKEIVPPGREKVPSPRYVVASGGKTMLNCEWSNERTSWELWQEWLPELNNGRTNAIISLSGREIQGCCNLIKRFDGCGATAYEVNVSCSHSGFLHGNLNVDFDHLAALMQAIRPITQNDIWVKLSYSPSVVDMAMLAQSLGANAIICTNTIGPGMFIDTESSKPKLGIKGGAGGVSGKAIFPIALHCVYQISQAVRIPVVGVGGIDCADDVVQMMMAGASAVQLYTAPSLKGPIVFKHIHTGLLDYFKEHKTEITDIIGLSHKWLENQTFDSPKPFVIKDKCRGCAKCVSACQFDSISVDAGKGGAYIYDSCISCNACVGVCPTNAIQARY